MATCMKNVTDDYLNYNKHTHDIYYVKTRYSQVGDDEHEWLDVEMTDILSGEWVREHIDEITGGSFAALEALQEGCDNYWGLKYKYPNVKLIWCLFQSYIDENGTIYSVTEKKKI